MEDNGLKPCPFCGGQAHMAYHAGEFVRNAKKADIKPSDLRKIEDNQVALSLDMF